MATKFFRDNPQLGVVQTTRTLSVATGAATQVFLGTANQGMTIFNNGSSNVFWGDSSIAINQGNILFVSARVEWLQLQDTWSVYLVADSIASTVSITEYRV